MMSQEEREQGLLDKKINRDCVKLTRLVSGIKLSDVYDVMDLLQSLGCLNEHGELIRVEFKQFLFSEKNNRKEGLM